MGRRNIQVALGGWSGWLFKKLNGAKRQEPRLRLVERITLAPRQTLALVEADGKRLLVATSADGGPAFYSLDNQGAAGSASTSRGCAHRPAGVPSARVSW